MTSLLGLQRLNSLVELYAGNNSVESIREVFYLKVGNNDALLNIHGIQLYCSQVTEQLKSYISCGFIVVTCVYYIVLQSLASLLILDLCGNPVATSMDNYRLFIVYHLRTLKALDGSAFVSLNL